MLFIKDCVLKLGTFITLTQALCWVFGVFDDATDIISDNTGIVTIALVVFVAVNYIFYDAPRSLERIRYEQKRKKVPRRGRK